MGLGDSLCECESITLGLGAGLTTAVAEVVDGLRVGIGSWLSDSFGDCLGSTLKLGAGLTAAVAEVMDRFRVGCWGSSCFRRSDGQEGGEEDGSNLHVEMLLEENVDWFRRCLSE